MHSARGIILKHEDFRERDERVILYTKEFGKISVVAKGIKRIEAKLRGNLDIFNFVDIIFVEGSNFYILTGIDLKERFPGIGSNPYIYKTALSIVGVSDRVTEENMRDNALFDSIMLVFERLNEYSRRVERECLPPFYFTHKRINFIEFVFHYIALQESKLRAVD